MVSKLKRKERKRRKIKQRLKEKRITREKEKKETESREENIEPVIEYKKDKRKDGENKNWEIQDIMLILIVIAVLFIFFNVAFFGLKTQ